MFVLIPFGMLSPKITTFFFYVKSISSSPGTVKMIHFLDYFNRLLFDFPFAVLDVLILVAPFDA